MSDEVSRVEAERLFEHCVEPLFALAWPEFEAGTLDVEIPGLAWPERFRQDACDLIIKLHEAGISPEALLAGARRGAEAFYGHANLAELARSEGLTDRQRASLIVDGATLAQQRRRELELAEVLTRLYRSFLAALAQGSTLAGAPPKCAREDVPEVDPSEARPTPRRVSPTLYRAPDAATEARFVASEIERLSHERGLPLGEIAVVAREARGCAAVERELAQRGLPFQYFGSTSLFDDPSVLDVLALAGAAWNPDDTVRLLRALQSPAIALSDRTLYQLCTPPPGPQAALFEELDEPGRALARRERRAALQRNVLEGLVDQELSPEARTRLQALRAALPHWHAAAQQLALDALLVHVADESGLLACIERLPVARRRHARRQLERLMAYARDFALAHPQAGLDGLLTEADDLATRDVLLPHDLPLEHDAVALLSAGQAYGREFEALFAIGTHAGSFPRYYSPPSFYFSQQFGVIARENVDDGGGPESAKFVWYSIRQQLAKRYYEQERSLFTSVLARASTLLYVTAYGRATRALRNPEFLEELRAAREAGMQDLTQIWSASEA